MDPLSTLLRLIQGPSQPRMRPRKLEARRGMIEHDRESLPRPVRPPHNRSVPDVQMTDDERALSGQLRHIEGADNYPATQTGYPVFRKAATPLPGTTPLSYDAQVAAIRRMLADGEMSPQDAMAAWMRLRNQTATESRR